MTSQALTTTEHERQLAHRLGIGHLANQAASAGAFADYLSRRSKQTLRRQRHDLATFAAFLATVGIDAAAEALQTTGDAWQGVTWGLVEGFVKWLLLQGYAVSTANVKLSTVKTYARLALKAGAISEQEYALMRTVIGYGHKEAVHLDEKRQEQAIPTRRGRKKAAPVRLTDDQAAALKAQPLDTPQGRRDAVLMALLLDLGLRAGEVAALTVDNVRFDDRQLVFYRPKVDKVQTHDLTPDLLAALQAWRDSGDMPPVGPLLRGSRKGGGLTEAGLSVTAITKRVTALGEKLGIDGLSAHDCRHYWATRAAQKVETGRATLFNLQEAGGWNSLAMPRRYVEQARIANKNLV